MGYHVGWTHNNKSYGTGMVRLTKIENLLNKLQYIVVSMRINSVVWEEM